jgi:hypothetical protein
MVILQFLCSAFRITSYPMPRRDSQALFCASLNFYFTFSLGILHFIAARIRFCKALFCSPFVLFWGKKKPALGGFFFFA